MSSDVTATVTCSVACEPVALAGLTCNDDGRRVAPGCSWTPAIDRARSWALILTDPESWHSTPDATAEAGGGAARAA